jgi:glycosyltransferase involved in cell wall biosynthesis
VDSAYFRPAGVEPEPDTLVFTGVMKYLPNSDGIRWFLAEVLPLVRESVPGVRLLVVGADPPPDLRRMASGGVTLTGRVGDVRPYVDRAAVSIVPLRMGGGTRLKIVEAFAMKKPVVSTTVGAEGIDVADGESILLADEPRAFADAVVRLLRDGRLREKLVRNAYALMMDRYEWSVIGGILEEGYAAALGTRDRAGRRERQSADLRGGGE